MSQPTRIGIVGPCKSGKTTLANNLTKQGYDAHQIAQEHSFAPTMWQRIGQPHLLIYLHCEFSTTQARGLDWPEDDYTEELARLAHARQHADLHLTTDIESPEEVLARARSFLEDAGASKTI